jgi:hypothetical protein
MMEGVNLAKIHCKHYCKCHSVPQYNNNNVIIKKERGRLCNRAQFTHLVSSGNRTCELS